MPTLEELGIPIFVVYKNPSDFLGKYVVREWRGMHAFEEPHCVTRSLRKARASIPEHLYRMDRFPEDDPAIVEVWF